MKSSFKEWEGSADIDQSALQVYLCFYGNLNTFSQLKHLCHDYFLIFRLIQTFTKLYCIFHQVNLCHPTHASTIVNGMKIDNWSASCKPSLPLPHYTWQWGVFTWCFLCIFDLILKLIDSVIIMITPHKTPIAYLCAGYFSILLKLVRPLQTSMILQCFENVVGVILSTCSHSWGFFSVGLEL